MNKHEILALDAVTARSRDDNGNLRVALSHLTKVQVAPYHGYEIPNWEDYGLDPNRTYYGYRSAEELSRPETVDSVNLIPIQLAHHPDYPDAPARSTRIGTTGESASFNEPYLDNSLCFTDERAIDHINDGSMRELSLAYRYTPDFTPGTTPDGEKYDFVMRHISANHLALVEQGRAGRDVLVADHAFKGLNMEEEKKQVPAQDDVPPAGAVAPAESSEGTQAVATPAIVITQPNAATPVTVESDDEAPQAAPAPAPAQDEGFDPVAVLKAKGFTDQQIAQIKEAFTAAAPQATDEESATAIAAADEAPQPTEAADEDPTQQAQDEDATAKDQAPCAQDRAMAQDAALKKSFSDGVAAGRKSAMAIFSAVDDVKSVIGARNAMSYDSAGAVYLDALKSVGFDTKGIPVSAARAVYSAYQAGMKKAQPMASDSAPKVDALAATIQKFSRN